MDKAKTLLGISAIGWTPGDGLGIGDYSAEHIMSEAALAGFSGCEKGRTFSQPPKYLKEMLDLRNLTLPACWFGSRLLTTPYEDEEARMLVQMNMLRELGASVINLCDQSYSIQTAADTGLSKRHILSEEEWDFLINGLLKLTKLANDNGFTVAYHHHMGTVIQSEEDVERLMTATEGSGLGLLVDTGHAVLAGIDPVGLVNKYGPRVKHIHLKDVRMAVLSKLQKEDASFPRIVLEGTFAVPGDGNYDFPQFLSALKKIGYQGWMIVEAETNPQIYHPFSCAKRTREYLRDACGI